ncbi:DUF2863 family protein [Noviherbaspirillum massiliense]|uniref:DUF2863 family protein n=1 Tax=Noviherbaspirillum massiliense TaxID=1465823 RepID=UPI0002D2B909|nr:DUF2863 family protein [Noviherbaspirillum massiliense]
MRRPSKASSRKHSGESQRLITLIEGQILAASRLEERTWERNVDSQLNKLLKSGYQDVIDAALDQLFKSDLEAYDVLMEAVEAASESCVVEHDGVQYEGLLIAAPILAWTRFSIPSGSIPADMVVTLSAHLHGHLLVPGAHLALAPTLFSIDQLPRSHVELFAITQRMVQAAVKNTPLRPLAHAPETAPFLADTRYLLAAVAAPAGEPLFRWQASLSPSERDAALRQWRTQAMPNVMKLLPGCGVELLLPEAYYVACREADKLIRPASIRAAVHFLTHTLGVEASGLRAIIGDFSEDPLGGRVDEYRISFTLRHSEEVLYGVVWPLYGDEDDEESAKVMAGSPASPDIMTTSVRSSPIEEVQALLKECGIVHIKYHTERFPMEFCDDCGTPMYPDLEGDLVHPEMPEDVPAGSGHFH